MSRTSKTKTCGINKPVPHTRDEASAAIRVIGERNREILRIEAALNDCIAKEKEAAEAKAAPLRADVDALTKGLSVWAEANRDGLTGGGKVKTADLGTGKISWRIRPPKVMVRGVESVIERLKTLGLQRFLRVSEAINKEAILAEKDVAAAVPGIIVGSEGEDFIVEPFETAIAAGPVV